jgi:alpha-N-acetylglucosaminidase
LTTYARRALHGVNAPLAFNGQEYVWYTVWQEMGLTMDEINAFYSSPAFLPWQRYIRRFACLLERKEELTSAYLTLACVCVRMGNLDGWQGPLTSSWIQGQYKLQQLILARARSLGMVAVLPGFAGSRTHQNASRTLAWRAELCSSPVHRSP